MTTPQALRTAISDLAVLAANDLDALWRQVSTPDEARDALRDVLPALVYTYSLASATISADWYDEIRDAIAARGRFQAIPFDPARHESESLAGYAVEPLYQAEPDWNRAQVLVAGGLQLRVANSSRFTVADSAIADPAADGWMRDGSGECGFCSMLIGRGAVYSESSVNFAAHQHCKCSAVPAWGGEPRPVEPYKPGARRVVDPKTGDLVPISKKERARVKKWIADHADDPRSV